MLNGFKDFNIIFMQQKECLHLRGLPDSLDITIDQIGIAVGRPLMPGDIEGEWRRNRVWDRMMVVGGRGGEEGEVGGGRGYLGHVQGEHGGGRLGQGRRAPSQRVHVSFKITVHHGISMVNHRTMMVHHFTGVGLSVSLLPVPVAFLQD